MMAQCFKGWLNIQTTRVYLAMTYSQEEYASYGPTGGSGVQTFFDD